MKSLGGLLIVVLTLQLVACGGSGGGTASPPPSQTMPQPTAQDLSNAKAAAVSASLDLSTNMVTLSWADTFPTASGYAIEQQTDTDTWATIDTVPGQGGNKAAVSWSRPVNVTETLRVQAVETSYDVTLLTQSGQQQTQVVVPAATPAIVLSQSEPVSGQVQVSVNNASQFSSAAYYVDLLALSTSTSAPDFSVNWDTTHLTSGGHLLVVTLQASPDFSIQLRRTVQVMSSAVAVSIISSGFETPASGPGPYQVVVSATSDAGIQSVTLSIDGTVVGTLTAPNGGSTYQFQVTAASGQHVLTAQATDNSGQSATATLTVTISNPPQLSLSSPVDGGLVNGTLHIAGTVTSDEPGPVRTVATLSALPVLNTTNSSFSTDFSLAGVAPGDYTLTVGATDSTGVSSAYQQFIVTVTSSPNLVYTPTKAIGADGSVLATDPGTVLYRASDQSVHRLSGWSSGASSDIILAAANSGGYSDWSLSEGNAFALSGQGPTGTSIDLIYWNAGGTSTDLGTVGTINPDFFAHLLMVHWPWALTSYWTVPAGSLTGNVTVTFFNAQTGAKVVPPLPEVSGIAGDFDFYSSAPGLTLFYMTDLGSNPGFNPVGIDSWSQASNQVTPLATGSFWQLDPQTDGTTVAWQSGPEGSHSGPYNLISHNIATSSESTLSSTMSQFQLADGLLAWAESGSNTTLIKAYDGASVTTISSLTSSHFYGTGGGYVLFGEGSKLYVWSAATGRQLILDAVPDTAEISGKSVYFTNGKQQLLYSVPLN